jgi:GNAT superfamily N-acetyltransferase
LTDERYRENRVAVAERDGELVGIAMSGPPSDAAAAWARQLYVLYVYAAHHGTDVGPALLEAVVDPEESVALWVAATTTVAATIGALDSRPDIDHLLAPNAMHGPVRSQRAGSSERPLARRSGGAHSSCPARSSSTV